MSKTFAINEIFCSLQGEGLRAGTANWFVRFAGCNLTCDGEVSEDGVLAPQCDTEFASGRRMPVEEILSTMEDREPKIKSVILTGGEPSLQVDEYFVGKLKAAGYYVSIETNGLIVLPKGLDWVTVSPKTAEHTIRQLTANEVKYVRAHGQGIPRPRCRAEHKLISPHFEGRALPRENLEWCIQLVKEHPEWRLSMQQHNFWGVR